MASCALSIRRRKATNDRLSRLSVVQLWWWLWLLEINPMQHLPHVLGWSARSRDREIARIQVCQNKHCKRNFVYLPQGTITLPEILQDLLSCSAPDGSGGDHSVEVVTTGCLSQCDRGPNIEITTRSNDGRGSEQQSYLCHGIQDHFQAAAELEMLGFPVLPQIIATYSVFVKAQKATNSEEKRNYLSAIIRTLDTLRVNTNSNEAGQGILARAMVERAATALSIATPSSQQWQEAVDDANRVLSMSRSSFTDSFSSAASTTAIGFGSLDCRRQAYRILLDAYELNNMRKECLQTLTTWFQEDPSFRSKLKVEMDRYRI